MKFDYDLVNEYCNKLEDLLAKIKNQYDDCERQIGIIKSSDAWDGPAANNFVTKAKKTLDKCRKTETALRNIIDYIKVCSKNYELTEQDIVKEISKSLK